MQLPDTRWPRVSLSDVLAKQDCNVDFFGSQWRKPIPEFAAPWTFNLQKQARNMKKKGPACCSGETFERLIVSKKIGYTGCTRCRAFKMHSRIATITTATTAPVVLVTLCAKHAWKHRVHPKHFGIWLQAAPLQTANVMTCLWLGPWQGVELLC